MENDLIELEISSLKNISMHTGKSNIYGSLETDLGRVIKHFDYTISFICDEYSIVFYNCAMRIYSHDITRPMLNINTSSDNCIKRFFREHPEFTYTLLRLSNILDEWEASN